MWLPTKATSSSKVAGQGSKLNHPSSSLLQAPAEGSQMIPSHMTLGTQRPSDSCPSTQIRSILLEDRNHFSLLTAFPRAGTWPLQRLGIGGRYRNMRRVALNLVLVCHGICGGWEESCLLYSSKNSVFSPWQYPPLGGVAWMSRGEVLNRCLALPSRPHYLTEPSTSHFQLTTSPRPLGLSLEIMDPEPWQAA